MPVTSCVGSGNRAFWMQMPGGAEMASTGPRTYILLLRRDLAPGSQANDLSWTFSTGGGVEGRGWNDDQHGANHPPADVFSAVIDDAGSLDVTTSPGGTTGWKGWHAWVVRYDGNAAPDTTSMDLHIMEANGTALIPVEVDFARGYFYQPGLFGPSGENAYFWKSGKVLLTSRRLTDAECVAEIRKSTQITANADVIFYNLGDSAANRAVNQKGGGGTDWTATGTAEQINDDAPPYPDDVPTLVVSSDGVAAAAIGSADVDVVATVGSSSVAPVAVGAADVDVVTSVSSAAVAPVAIGTADVDVRVSASSASVAPAAVGAAGVAVRVAVGSAAVAPHAVSSAGVGVQVQASSAGIAPLAVGSAQVHVEQETVNHVMSNGIAPAATSSAEVAVRLLLSVNSVAPVAVSGTVPPPRPSVRRCPIQVHRLRVRSLSVDFNEVSWEVDEPTIDVLDFRFQVLRSEGAMGPWDTISPPLTDQYVYVDNVIKGGNPERTYFYIIRVHNQLTHEYWDTEAAWLVQDADLVGSELRSHINLLMHEFIGELCWVLPKRTFGARCPACWNPALKKSTRSGCRTCWDTTFIRGYMRPIESWISFDPAQRAKEVSTMGETMQRNTTARMAYFPPLKPNDLIVQSAEKKRWRVVSVSETKHVGTPVHQELQLHEVPNTSIEYTVPIELCDELRNMFLKPARNFTNPQQLETVDDHTFSAVLAMYNAGCRPDDAC